MLDRVSGRRPPKSVKPHNACAVWDFSFFGDPKEGTIPNEQEFRVLLQPLGKKWAFQLEKAPTTGRLHYQGRISLFKKKRHGELCGLLNTTPLRGMHVSESTLCTFQDEHFYALKYDTRVDGPWDDRTFKAAPYVPRQFRGLADKLYPWQVTVTELLIYLRSQITKNCSKLSVTNFQAKTKETQV